MTSSSYTEALITYNEQRFRGDYKLTFAEMWTMANTLDVMRQMANLHNKGEWPAAIYDHLEKAELEILRHLYGPENAARIMHHVIENGESIAYQLHQARTHDEIRAYEPQYVATINQPGYMPMDDEPSVFDDIESAWRYLAGELERAWDAEYDGVAEDSERHNARDAIDARYLGAHAFMHNAPDAVGSVHVDGPTDTHLGYVYSVSVYEQ